MIAPHLNKSIGDFYVSLLRSEARHYQDYLTLAESIAGKDIGERVNFFKDIEAALIASEDADFKFHIDIHCYILPGLLSASIKSLNKDCSIPLYQ